MTAVCGGWCCCVVAVVKVEHALHIGQCRLERLDLGFHLRLPLVLAIEQRLEALVDDALDVQARAAAAALLAVFEIAFHLAMLARLAWKASHTSAFAGHTHSQTGAP